MTAMARTITIRDERLWRFLRWAFGTGGIYEVDRTFELAPDIWECIDAHRGPLDTDEEALRKALAAKGCVIPSPPPA